MGASAAKLLPVIGKRGAQHQIDRAGLPLQVDEDADDSQLVRPDRVRDGWL